MNEMKLSMKQKKNEIKIEKETKKFLFDITQHKAMIEWQKKIFSNDNDDV